MRVFLFSLFACLAFCAGLLLPEQALAWGPGVHMVTGNWLLQNLGVLPADIAALLMQHPGRFLHGILSADIFIGKGSKAKEGHSHNWSCGFDLLDKATSGEQRAYAYGYLSHLAADVVAHNVYVPGLFSTAPGHGKTSHIYLEIQADRLLDWDSGDALGVFHEKSSPKALAMLRHSMHRKSLPFWLNTQLFQGGIAVGGSNVWRGSLRMLDRLFCAHDSAALLERMLAISTRAMVNVLQEGGNSRLLQLDPIGADALALAERLDRGNTVIPQGLGRNLAKGVNRGLDRVLRHNLKSLRLSLQTGEAMGTKPPVLDVPPLLDSLPSLCSPEDTPHE